METIFRKESEGEILAVFLDFVHGSLLDCYAHVGQHGTCSVDYVINDTTPATPEERDPLYHELCGIGYSDIDVLEDVPEWLVKGERRP